MANTYHLAGRTAIVTGGAKGIGRAIAELFVRNGAEIIVCDKHGADIGGALSHTVDITDERSMGRLGRPREVAELVAWLCSDAGAFNTGAIFDMSGGGARY